MKHDTYLSYSPRADKELAEALESEINRSSKTFYGFGPNRVFSHRSKPGGYLESSEFRKALETAKHFILLASPESAHSPNVEAELIVWLRNRPIENLIIVLTDGEISLDFRSEDLENEESSALPLILRQALKEPPLYIDLRWARDVASFKRRYQFMDAVAQISAVLEGVSKDTLLR